jgi:large subunit ribosomal protein L20
VKINAAVRKEGMSYSRFIDALHKKGVKLDRKVLSQIAEAEPEVFKKIVEFVK